MNVNFKMLPEAVVLVDLDTKEQVLDRLSKIFSEVYGLDAVQILEGLEQREALGSTGFGRGVAIPHCRSESVKSPTCVLMKLENPVDFAAADAMPVSLIFGLVSPENAGVTHLHALAAISRPTRDEAMLQMLFDAANSDALYSVFTNQFLRDAA